MLNKTSKNILTVSGIGLFALVFSFSLYFFKSSYAITVNDEGVPTSTFTSNFSGTSTINYIEKALGPSDQQRKFFENFSVPINYRSDDNKYPLYILTKNSRFARTTEQFEMVSGSNPTTVTDSGIKYILAHGYNNLNVNNIFSTNKYGSINNELQEYLTQIALWLYLYENKDSFKTTYCKNVNVHLSSSDTTPKAYKEMNGCDFYHSSYSGNYNIEYTTKENIETIISNAAAQNGYEYFNYVLELVNNAKTDNQDSDTSIGLSLSSTESSNYTISKDGKTLNTEVIVPNTTNPNFPILSYSVKVNDPNNYGAYVTDINGEKINDSNNVNSNGFKIYIPLKDNMDLTSVKVTVTANFLKLDSNSYHVTKSTSSDQTFNTKDKKLIFSDILLGYIPTQPVSKNLSLKNLVKISKIDATKKEELPGATLVLKNKSTSKEISKWVSTSTPKYLYLENGEYTLCETIAPDNYSLNTECIDFKVDGSTTPTITMKNELIPPVAVPNTGSFINKLLLIMGSTALLTGIILLGITFYKKKISLN